MKTVKKELSKVRKMSKMAMKKTKGGADADQVVIGKGFARK